MMGLRKQSEMPRCKTCLFYAPQDTRVEQTTGGCHYYPPQAPTRSQRVHENDWCSFHEARGAEEAEEATAKAK